MMRFDNTFSQRTFVVVLFADRSVLARSVAIQGRTVMMVIAVEHVLAGRVRDTALVVDPLLVLVVLPHEQIVVAD
jgi:hypothetical protein